MNPKNMQNMMPYYLKIKKLVEDEEIDFAEEEEEEEDLQEEEEEEERGVQAKLIESRLKKQRSSLGEGSGKSCVAVAAPPCCLVENCEADLSGCKKYHQRHRVCEIHAKAPVVLVDGLRQRFCQQCSRFHELSEFDQTKRSCRRRLAGHNERRRKSSLESQNEGSSRRLKENQCRQLNNGSDIGSPGSQKLHIHSTH